MKTPQKLGGVSTLFTTPHKSPVKTVPLRGLFSEGTWKCNCDPRLPAAFFEVKKEGRNQGRWFYTCQLPRDDGCGFFLWKDDAVGREIGAVMNNSRTEPSRTPSKPTTNSDNYAKKNWIKNLGKSDDDEFGEFPLSAQDVNEVSFRFEEREISATPTPTPYPETPRKAIKTEHAATPGSKRKREDYILPTPSTRGLRDDDVFTGGPERHMWGGSEGSGLRSPSATPTPSRFRDALQDAEIQLERSKQGYAISDEVMDLLKDQHIDVGTTLALQSLLSKHAMKVSGIEKGRDISRLALKTKDIKIAELQQKITALETEREMDKSIIRTFKSDMAHSVSSRGGRGRGRSTER